MSNTLSFPFWIVFLSPSFSEGCGSFSSTLVQRASIFSLEIKSDRRLCGVGIGRRQTFIYQRAPPINNCSFSILTLFLNFLQLTLVCNSLSLSLSLSHNSRSLLTQVCNSLSLSHNSRSLLTQVCNSPCSLFLSTLSCLQSLSFPLLAFNSLSAYSCFQISLCPFGWGCRIHQLLLCRGVRPPPNECPGYDT